MHSVPANPDAPDSRRERVLFLLKTKGPMTASRLARRLGVTSAAVHQHLSSLEEEGLVDFTKERPKVGRPAHVWELTPKGHEGFPDCHAELAVGILQAIQVAFGDEGMERLAQERTRGQIEDYRTRMPPPDTPIEDRVRALAEIREAEGYMAEWGRGCGGTIEFVENHCSIAKAAQFCPCLCDGELALFRAVLGEDVRVNRVEHTLCGDSRCTYQIVELGHGTAAKSPSGVPKKVAAS